MIQIYDCFIILHQENTFRTFFVSEKITIIYPSISPSVSLSTPFSPVINTTFFGTKKLPVKSYSMAKGKLKSLLIDNFEPINLEGTPLTKEKFRELSGYTNLSDDEAEEAMHSIRLLVKILYEFASKQNDVCTENQQVIQFGTNHTQTQKQAA